MSAPPLDDLPGYRRRFVITPGPGSATSELEDDFHHMRVTVHHDGKVATAINSETVRAPWNTCPGAGQQVARTFTNVPLDQFPKAAGKTSNCTHLYDLAVLAASHAHDPAPLVYDILVSDPIEGKRRAELRRNGEKVMSWADKSFQLVEPAEVAGMPLTKLRPWIDSLDPTRQEYARLLQWASMVAHGRTLPMEQQSDATKMQPSCYTFQPDVAKNARRIGEVRDFSTGGAQPLGQRHTH